MNYQSKEHDKLKAIPEEQLPQVTAFQDEFTRKFMDSTKPVQEGYYLFRSGVNGYTMLFPENAKITDLAYSAPGSHFETMSFGGDYGKAEKNEVYYAKVQYRSTDFTEWSGDELGWVHSYFNFHDKFEKKGYAR
ncbi:hypothetical protein [Numidum massiliense]|uniref:hypothetical protein n=1 Tax=Numidum massiliense TaxID=1522315 RepID=UPI0006D5B095|nr:hypothetical protein [Numidum massiliense]